MRKVSSGIVILFLFAASCSKKSDPVAVSDVGCLLTKMVYTQPSSSYTMTDTYEYDSDRRLVKVNEVTSFPGSPTTNLAITHTYANGMVTTVKIESTTAGTSPSVFAWTNDGSRISKISGPTTQALTYDANGNLKTSESIFSGITSTSTYTFSGDLQSVSNVAANPGGPVKVDYSYGSFDGHKSQYTLLAKAINQPFYIHQGFLLSPQFFFKANPLSDRFVFTLPGSAPETTDSIYEYEYNAKGYPTKITRKINGQTDGVTTLEYKDCS